MQVKLERYSYSKTETEGELFIRSGGKTFNFATIERPWIPNPNGARGGKPVESCVPDGAYVLSPWRRPLGDEVYILYSPELGVYREPDEHKPEQGRNLILIHSANWTYQIHGCIAPGLQRYPLSSPRTDRVEQAVTSSRLAMSRIRELLGGKAHTLLITNETGASDVSV